MHIIRVLPQSNGRVELAVKATLDPTKIKKGKKNRKHARKIHKKEQIIKTVEGFINVWNAPP